ncbi:MAG: alpha/beta fold hydrolase [Vulcanimicrobiaceae bacterium]
MSAGERPVALDDGSQTTLEWWGGAGPVVLCVHGITSSRRSWARLGERLAASRRTFAYDQRGHGDSAAVPGPMTLERSVADLAEVAKTLPGPVDLLVGHSWGGAVALAGARTLGARTVLVVDPMVRVAPETFEADYVDDLRETFALGGAAREQAIRQMYAGLPEVEVAGKLHAMRSMSIGALERLGRDNRVDAGGWDLRATVANFPVPLLVLAAGVESVLSPGDLRELRERGGPNVTVRVVEGQGHNLQRTDFEGFVDALLTFA